MLDFLKLVKLVKLVFLNIPNAVYEFVISIILCDYQRFFYSHNNLDITGIISCSGSLISCHVS